MKDMVPLGTGNSRFLKSVENFKTLYPDYDSFAAALIAGTLPIDFNGINPEGIKQLGTAVSASTLLKDETAAKFGLSGENAIPDKAFLALSAYLLSVGATSITLLDEDGNPLPGVRIDGATSTSGESVSTDDSGMAVVAVTANIDVTFVSPYADIPDCKTTLSPNYEELNTITIIMPYVAAGSTVIVSTSGAVTFRKARTIDMSLVGGGSGGNGGTEGHIGANPGYNAGGSGGSGGKILNITGQAVSGSYELVVGAGGTSGSSNGGTGGAGGTTTFGTWSSASGSTSNTAVGGITAGGSGGSGGDGGYRWTQYYSGTVGSTGSRAGGAGGYGALAPIGDGSGDMYSYAEAGKAGGLGGGGGGGGGGADAYTGYSVDTTGASGGAGGSGGLIILF